MHFVFLVLPVSNPSPAFLIPSLPNISENLFELLFDLLRISPFLKMDEKPSIFQTFCKSENTFDSNNHMWCLFLIRWHLTILKWTGATLCTLIVDIMWLLTLLIVLFLLFAPCICNCVTGFVSSHMKAFKLQMVAQTLATAAASSSYYLGPLDQRPSIWRLGEYVASTI